MKNVRKTVVTFGFILGATMLGKILGLVRNMFIAHNYGATMETDAFYAASNLPLQFLELTLAAAITSVFIPVFNEYYQQKGKKRAIEFASNFLNIVVLLATIITMIGVVFAPFIVSLTLNGFDPEKQALTVQLTRILFPMIIFTSATYTFVGILQSFEEFNVPATISVISNIVIIIYLIFFNKYYGIQGLAVMYVVGWGFQLVYQLPFVIKNGYRHYLTLNFMSPGMKKVYKLFMPILISSWAVPINKMATNFFASYIENAVSILDYANQVYIIIVGVFTLAVGNLIFPSLARNMTEGNHEAVTGTIRQALRSTIFILVPLMVGIMLLREDVMGVLYYSDRFTKGDVTATSYALMFLSVGMVGFGMREILNRAFYAISDTKTPLVCGIQGMVLNVILCGILSVVWGYKGLALANAMSVSAIGVLLFIKLQKTNFVIFESKDFMDFVKMVVSALIMGITVYFLRNIVGDYSRQSRIIVFAQMAGVGILGFSIYFVSTLILRVEESVMALSLVRRKG